MATTDILLEVPFAEKDLAKSLGARWKSSEKKWYVPAGVDATAFEPWLPKGTVVTNTAGTTKTTSPQPAPRTRSTNGREYSEEEMDSINSELRDAREYQEA